MEWPRKVFLESTALFQQGSKLQKPELAKLKERQGNLKFDVLVSEVSWAEYVRQRADKLNELAGDLKSVSTRLVDWNQDSQGVIAAQAKLLEFRKDIGKLYANKATDAGINILDLPVIDVRRLFRMSMDRVPPFEQSKDDKSEKGFRDALIMFSILENIKGRPEDFSLVVTNDGLLTKGLNIHADEFKTKLTVVPNLDEAIAHIDARVDAWYRDFLRKESEAAKAELTRHMKEISDQVTAIRELSDADFGVGTLGAMLAAPRVLDFGESIERVSSLRVDQIESAVWGDKDKPESRILFRIRCTANVVTSVTTPFSWAAAPTKYEVGGARQQPSFLTLNALSAAPKQERERALPLTLYGEVKLQRTNGDWNLLSVRIDKSQSISQDMTTLMHLL
jgi:hypothetical protein